MWLSKDCLFASRFALMALACCSLAIPCWRMRSITAAFSAEMTLSFLRYDATTAFSVAASESAYFCGILDMLKANAQVQVHRKQDNQWTNLSRSRVVARADQVVRGGRFAVIAAHLVSHTHVILEQVWIQRTYDFWAASGHAPIHQALGLRITGIDDLLKGRLQAQHLAVRALG